MKKAATAAVRQRVAPAFDQRGAGGELPARRAFGDRELDDDAEDERPDQREPVLGASDGGRHHVADADARGGQQEPGTKLGKPLGELHGRPIMSYRQSVESAPSGPGLQTRPVPLMSWFAEASHGGTNREAWGLSPPLLDRAGDRVRGRASAGRGNRGGSRRPQTPLVPTAFSRSREGTIGAARTRSAKPSRLPSCSTRGCGHV